MSHFKAPSKARNTIYHVLHLFFSFERLAKRPRPLLPYRRRIARRPRTFHNPRQKLYFHATEDTRPAEITHTPTMLLSQVLCSTKQARNSPSQPFGGEQPHGERRRDRERPWSRDDDDDDTAILLLSSWHKHATYLSDLPCTLPVSKTPMSRITATAWQRCM